MSATDTVTRGIIASGAEMRLNNICQNHICGAGTKQALLLEESTLSTIVSAGIKPFAMPFGASHAPIRSLAKWSLSSFFQEIQVVGGERVPKDGPLIL
jgi:hypothetical protein